MSIYLVAPSLLIVAVLQTAVIPHVELWGVFPDLPVLVVVSWSLLQGKREGAVWGFIAGLGVDLFSGAPLGAATLALVGVGLLSGSGQATVFRGHIALPLVTMFVATFVYNLIFLLVVQIAGQPVVWLDSLVGIVLPAALFNTLLTPVVFWLMRIVKTWFGHEEMEW